MLATPEDDDLDGHLASFEAAAGERQFPLLVLLPVLLLLLEFAGLGWPTGGDLRPSLSLNAIADDDRVVAGELLD